MAKTTALDAIWDAQAPADVEAERLLLSVIVPQNASGRRLPLLSLSPDDFYDEFHAWLWRALRANPTAEHPELLKRLQAHPKPDWLTHRGFWVATVLFNRSGHDIAGRYVFWPVYRDRIKNASNARKAIDGAYEFIQQQFNKWQDLQWGFHHPPRRGD